MSETKPKRTLDIELEAMIGALTGICIIAVIQFISLPSLDGALKVSVYCFAVSLPLLTFSLLSLVGSTNKVHSDFMWYFWVAFILGPLGSLVGIAGLFFHFSWRAGLIFSALAITCLCLYQAQRRVLRRIRYGE